MAITTNIKCSLFIKASFDRHPHVFSLEDEYVSTSNPQSVLTFSDRESYSRRNQLAGLLQCDGFAIEFRFYHGVFLSDIIEILFFVVVAGLFTVKRFA